MRIDKTRVTLTDAKAARLGGQKGESGVAVSVFIPLADLTPDEIGKLINAYGRRVDLTIARDEEVQATFLESDSVVIPVDADDAVEPEDVEVEPDEDGDEQAGDGDEYGTKALMAPAAALAAGK